ncbi:MAG TPA: hypothetical protein DGR79_06290 [Clostridiales bacterium]|nr:hypothetical protein [Clostridiales bacterium]
MARSCSGGSQISLVRELRSHIPYSVFSVTLALVLTGMLTSVFLLLDPLQTPAAAGRLFHCFHPPHILLSATATTAMFWRHERNLWKSVIIGFVGSVAVCGVSDVLIPYLGGLLLGVDMHLHFCFLEHPLLVVPFVALGIFTGLVAAEEIPRVTFFSHSGHVLTSSMASILYLVSFGLTDWVSSLGAVFPLVVVAVVVPCCTSDIVFPMLLVSRRAPDASAPVARPAPPVP